MIPFGFWLTNIHFIISAFGAYAFFVIFWLQLEQPKIRQSLLLQLRTGGFFILGIAFIIHGFKVITPEIWHIGTLLLGSILVALSFIRTPSSKRSRKKPVQVPLLLWAIGLLVFGFLVESAHLVEPLHTEQATTLFSAFGISWYFEHISLAVGVLLFSHWIWLHIKHRVLPQVYMTVIAVGMLSFFFSTIIYTNILYSTTEQQALTAMEVNTRVMSLTLQDITEHTELAAAALAGQDTLARAVEENNAQDIHAALDNSLTTYQVARVYVINAAGEVLETEGGTINSGVSLSNDPLIATIISGKRAGAPTKDITDEANIVLRGGAPVVRNNIVVGAVIIDTPVDNALVDYISKTTGLSITIYADQQRIATTLRDATNRPLGPTAIEDPQIAHTVLERNSSFKGVSTIASRPYFVAAIPLADTSKKPIGIVLAALPESSLVNTLESTTLIGFTFASLMSVFTLIPFYIISKMLKKYITNL